MIKQSDALRSLFSTLCPACGKSKVARQTLCRADFMKLPAGQRKHLYDGTGEGYEEAIEAAFKSLGVTEPHWPKEE